MNLMIYIFNKLTYLLRKLLGTRSHNSHIIILSFKFIGDTVFTIPAIQKIIDLNPGNKITICCYSVNKDIYKIYFNSVDYLIFAKNDLKLNNRWIDRKFIQAASQIRSLRPGITFDFTSCWKSALISIIIGSGDQIGFGNPLLNGFYDFFVPAHEVKQTELFLKPVNLFYNETEYTFKLKVPDNKISNISVCIIPFAGWKAKEWNLKKYIELAVVLSKNYSTKILYEQGKMGKEFEEFLVESGIDFISTDSIDDLIKEISKYSLVISNDTGPLYLGYLLGKYSFGIFGPSNPDFHLFDTNRQYYVQKKLLCSPKTGEKLCFTFGGRNGCPSYECMNLLSIEEVIEKLSEYILRIKSENVLS